jgi:hypothetical protein
MRTRCGKRCQATAKAAPTRLTYLNVIFPRPHQEVIREVSWHISTAALQSATRIVAILVVVVVVVVARVMATGIDRASRQILLARHAHSPHSYD